MNDQMISYDLAKAIGWKDVIVYNHIVWVREWKTPLVRTTYAPFDYKDWAVISPVAEKFDAFPAQQWDGTWDAYSTALHTFAEADSPQKAIALAVIEGSKK